MLVLIYNNDTHSMEQYELGLDENMPYTQNMKITVGAFSVNSFTKILWAERNFLKNISDLLNLIDCDFDITSGFSRIFEVFTNERLHNKRGNAIDGGTNFSYQQDLKFRKLVEQCNNFTYVNQKDNEYSFSHINAHRNFTSEYVPFEMIKLNDVGVDVCILQDTLWYLGYDVKAINGNFDIELEAELKLFQVANNLTPTGICDSDTWFMLMHYVREDDLTFQLN